MEHLMTYTPTLSVADRGPVPDFTFYLNKDTDTVCSCGMTLKEFRESVKDGHLVQANDAFYALLHQIVELQNTVASLRQEMDEKQDKKFIGPTKVATHSGFTFTLSEINDMLKQRTGSVLVLIVDKKTGYLASAYIGNRDGTPIV